MFESMDKKANEHSIPWASIFGGFSKMNIFGGKGRFCGYFCGSSQSINILGVIYMHFRVFS